MLVDYVEIECFITLGVSIARIITLGVSIAHVDCPVLILRRAELAMDTSHTPSASPKL